jgi:hypothetical protein
MHCNSFNLPSNSNSDPMLSLHQTAFPLLHSSTITLNYFLVSFSFLIIRCFYHIYGCTKHENMPATTFDWIFFFVFILLFFKSFVITTKCVLKWTLSEKMFWCLLEEKCIVYKEVSPPEFLARIFTTLCKNKISLGNFLLYLLNSF